MNHENILIQLLSSTDSPPPKKNCVPLLCWNNQMPQKSCCMVLCMVYVYMFYMWANHPPSKQLKLPPPLLQNGWGVLCQEDILIWVVNKHARKGDILATSFIHYFEYQHSSNIKTTIFYTKIMLMILPVYCISNSHTQWQKWLNPWILY